ACSQPAGDTPREKTAGGAPADPPAPGSVTDATKAANAAMADRLPLDDPGDFTDARRGLLAQIEADAIRDSEGDVIWPIAQYEEGCQSRSDRLSSPGRLWCLASKRKDLINP
ncbi:MAG: hypothetical protein GVY13_16980, partial [Alphaproteobacteria bacterium]|nr:hypothetical protein [Alphaproteobacteria bacterium]